MNETLKDILVKLRNRKVIGNKHTPEDKLLKKKIKWLKKRKEDSSKKNTNK